MKRLVTLLFILMPMLLFAQDIIITMNEEKIDAKIITVTKTEVHYKKQSNIEGPTFILPKEDIHTIIFCDGSVNTFIHNSTPVNTQPIAMQGTTIVEEIHDQNIYTTAEFRGTYLPKFSYQKVHVPGKKNKKWRYCGGNMILTEREFGNFLQMYCKEAYEHYRKANIWSTVGCCLILVGFVPTLVCCIVAMSHSSQILSTYNIYCATQEIGLNTEFIMEDQIQLAKIIPLE